MYHVKKKLIEILFITDKLQVHTKQNKKQIR